ncbi:MAG: Sau3AI family type II restriction endonuclease [Coriobacteriia bacterium]|nr:Sau3AI family type II restriction endonuclease [Coriobacteriia bacterium]
MDSRATNPDYLVRNVDEMDADELEAYSKQLEGMTFREVLEAGFVGEEEAPALSSRDYSPKEYKGGVGTLIEERFFGYRANSDDRPDFPNAGVELKTTCFDVKKNGDYSAGERVSITMIPFNREVEPDFYRSHVWSKAEKTLLVYYQRDRSVDTYDQRIWFTRLFTPSDIDLKIIVDDYEKICSIIEEGKAEELSESLTSYLGAATKGSTEATMWVEQFYPPHTKAKRRAFCFKRQYMDYVLHNHVMPAQDTDASVESEPAEPIIKDIEVLGDKTFEEFVVSVIGRYAGKTDRELCEIFDIDYSGNKAQWTQLSYLMLGVRGAHAEEFEKANVSVRTVRKEPSGKIKESLSLATFTFEDIATQNWDESALLEYLEQTRFFFVVFEKCRGVAVLKGATFWSMPVSDVLGSARDCWECTKRTIRQGVELTPRRRKDGKVIVYNNLPKRADNAVAHVRPHTGLAAYRLADGTEIGDVARHAHELPDGQWMTKQSFWLNSHYVANILRGAGL